jgi:uroporphyrinogen decarboxylase
LAPMRHMNDLEDIDSFPHWPNPDDPVYYYPEARDYAKQLHDDNHYIVYGEPHYGGTVDFTYMWLRGLDNWMMDPYVRPDYFMKLMEKITELSIEITSRWLKLVGEYLDVLVFCADLGTQNKPMISADHYAKWLLPNHKLWVSEMKKLTKAKVQLHSCGSVYELLPGFIEAGFDIINPIQPLAKNMDPGKIKKEFGDRVVLHGGGDLQEMLPHGSTEDVERGIKELMQKAAPGGGYMFAFANNIPPDAPPENIVTAYDAVVKYGRYPIQP